MQEHNPKKGLSLRLPARIKQVAYPHILAILFLSKYLRALGGVLLAATLLLPLFWIPGLVILVLPSEVYLLDWVHSQYTKSLGNKALFDESSEPENDFEEAERKRNALPRSRHWEFAR